MITQSLSFRRVWTDGLGVARAAIALAACLSCASTGAAQAPQKAVAPPSVCSTSTKLTPLDPQTIVAALQKADLAKRELETTAEFRQRIGPALAGIEQLLAKSGRPELMLLVPIAPDHFKYDADSSTMSLSGAAGVIDRDVSGGAIRITSWDQDVGTYEGVNSFGVRKEVTKRKSKIVRITGPKLTLEQMIARKNLQFPLARNEAAEAKANIVVLVVARLKAPYYSTYESRLSPKIDFPYDYIIQNELIHADIICTALFNQATGKTIRVVSLSQL